MRTTELVPTSISSQDLLQLCYPLIIKGDYGEFSLLYNHKEQDGTGF
jgi:hypothetical protein